MPGGNSYDLVKNNNCTHFERRRDRVIRLYLNYLEFSLITIHFLKIISGEWPYADHH